MLPVGLPGAVDADIAKWDYQENMEVLMYFLEYRQVSYFVVNSQKNTQSLGGW